MNFSIIVDSVCEIPENIDENIKIYSVPLVMELGDKTYIDDKNLNISQFIDDMNKFAGKPSSACPSPTQFSDNFDDSEYTFIITISSKLSGSYFSAKTAADMNNTDKKIYVFDSLSASSGCSLILCKLCEYINKGFSFEDIIEKLEKFIKEVRTLFVLENLDNLVKNGRLNKVVGGLAGFLGIRLILGDNDEGEIISYAKSKGKNACIEKLFGIISEVKRTEERDTLVITHCNAEDKVEHLLNLVKSSKVNFKNIKVLKTAGISSMYANVGGIIVAF